MTSADIILSETLASLPFIPIDGQLEVLHRAAAFVADGAPGDVFVLNGYAGTGKTSLVGALIKAMRTLRRRVIVLAPTGRAAKVASSFSGHEASTIHRRIFRPDPSDPSGQKYCIAPNTLTDTIFIVDEASLIPDSPQSRRSLLAMLIYYVYSAPGCRMMLIGDEAQLPPVGQNISLAMNPERLSSLGLHPICTTLDIPVRQTADSGIVHNATLVRHALFHRTQDYIPHLDAAGYTDFCVISSLELADALSASYSEVGEDQTIIVTRSNRRANSFNAEIRARVFYAEEPLQRGDRLIVSRNDYYWGRANQTRLRLIANGDMAEVKWVGKTQKMYGRFFTEAELEMTDGTVINAQIMLRSIVSDGPTIPREEQRRFEETVINEYEGEYSERLKQALEDPFYNALHVKYAYCVTCHKAQGGQWKHVYVDMSGIDTSALDDDFYRWLYTAITRSTERVILINPTLPVRK